MKRAVALAIVVLTAASASVDAAEIVADYEVIPLPRKVMPGRGLPFSLNSKTVITVPKGDRVLKRNAQLLAGYLKDLTGISPRIVTDIRESNAIRLSAELNNSNKEAYELNVGKNLITIDGSSAAGNFYGIQTLRKSIGKPAKKGDEVIFPAVTVSDAPRFGYRGGHLDTARYYFTVDSVKRYIDMLALHNINRFHWHMTEDQGWRFESKKYPLLTEIGSKRAQTVIGRNSGKYDGKPYGGFYSQKDAREIVKYAADRHITVIPEIDLPGHMVAALAAYPELGCTGGPYKVKESWGVMDDVLCAGNDKTYKFIEDILNELMDVFPSEYIHIGGDECPKVRWEKCPKCQAKIKELGIVGDERSTAEQKLQNHVMETAAKVLASRGRKMIGWDEILEGGLFPGATVMSWRGTEAAAQAAKEGYDAILTPTSYCYLDYYQSDDHSKEPLGIGGNLPIEKVYSLEPVAPELTPGQAKHILGAQCNVWSEFIPHFSHAEHMALPRMAAISEVQWTEPEQKDLEGFLKRLPQLVNIYRNEGYNYAKYIPQAQ